jgi:hypothetical protein
MPDTTGGRDRKGVRKAGKPARGPAKGKRAAPPPKAAAKTLGRRRAKAPREPPKAQAQNGGGPRPTGPDWDELAEKASQRFEQTAQKAGEAARKAGTEARRIALDMSEGFDKAWGKVRAEADHMVKKGQHTRVRIKFRGRQVGPDLPVAVVAAAEIASLWWAGPLRLILAHVVGQAVLDVEFVNDAQSHVAAGKAFLASGDLDDAVREFDLALSMDRGSAGAHLGRGICFKLRGDKDVARREFTLAESCDPHGEAGREARRHLDNLG